MFVHVLVCSHIPVFTVALSKIGEVSIKKIPGLSYYAARMENAVMYHLSKCTIHRPGLLLLCRVTCRGLESLHAK